MQCIRHRCNIGRSTSPLLTGGVELIANTIVVIVIEIGIFLLLWFSLWVNLLLYGYLRLIYFCCCYWLPLFCSFSFLEYLKLLLNPMDCGKKRWDCSWGVENGLWMKTRCFTLSSGVLGWACSLVFAGEVCKFVRWLSEEVGVYMMNCCGILVGDCERR